MTGKLESKAMSPDIDTRDRVIRMETELKALKEEVDQMRVKVNEIHSLLTQARGAQTAVKFLVWLSGTSIFLWVSQYLELFTNIIRGKGIGQ